MAATSSRASSLAKSSASLAKTTVTAASLIGPLKQQGNLSLPRTAWLLKAPEDGMTVNSFLKNHEDFSPWLFSKEIDDWPALRSAELYRKHVWVDDVPLSKLGEGSNRFEEFILRKGSQVAVHVPAPKNFFDAATIPLKIIAQDELLLAVEKPSNLLSMPIGNTLFKNLLSAVHARFRTMDWREFRTCTPRLANRLDMPTSGLILLTMAEPNAPAVQNINAQFFRHQVYKEYIALVHGKIPENGEANYSVPIRYTHKRVEGRSRSRGGQREVLEEVTATTTWERLDYFPSHQISIVKLIPKTGRLHQLRIHTAKLGHPILFDAEHGDEEKDARLLKAQCVLERLALHSSFVSLLHPLAGKEVTFESSLPLDMVNFVEKILKGKAKDPPSTSRRGDDRKKKYQIRGKSHD